MIYFFDIVRFLSENKSIKICHSRKKDIFTPILNLTFANPDWLQNNNLILIYIHFFFLGFTSISYSWNIISYFYQCFIGINRFVLFVELIRAIFRQHLSVYRFKTIKQHLTYLETTKIINSQVIKNKSNNTNQTR